MNNFLDKLNQIEQQLKEETNGQQAGRNVSENRGHSSGSSNGVSNNKDKSNSDSSNGSRGGDVFHRGIFRQIELNNVTGKEKVMITAEAAATDLEDIEKLGVTDGVKIVRAIKVLVKFLSTMRSNQLLTDADKVAIQKAKATRKPEEKKA
jgi:hypothetical protein